MSETKKAAAEKEMVKMAKTVQHLPEKAREHMMKSEKFQKLSKIIYNES